MKNLKILLLIVAVMAGSWALEAKTFKVNPRIGVVVTTVHKPNIIVHKGVNFYYAKGVWYKPHGRKYIVCKAPIGIRVRTLPRGYKKVRIHGKKYYTFNGVWYAKKGRTYTVVKIG